MAKSASPFTYKLLAIFTVAFLGVLLLLAPEGHGQSAQKLKTQEEIVRQEMVDISRQLNVTCTECHKLNNFKDSSKKSFKVGKEHMRIVEILRTSGFDGKSGPEASCFMCHRGVLKPVYAEKPKPM